MAEDFMIDTLVFYPIGSIVEYLGSANPNTAIGGTWTQDTTQSILVGQDNAYFSGALGTTVGSASATAGYPNHDHTSQCRGIAATTGAGGSWGDFHASGSTVKRIPNTNNRVFEYYGEGTFTANGSAHENRMRSLNVIRWIRTA